MTLIAITNPSDESAESGIVYESTAEVFTPAAILERFGDKLEDGAQVVLVEGGRVWQYLATRTPDPNDGANDGAPIALRPNNALGVSARYNGDTFIDYMNAGNGDIIEYGTQLLEAELPLETYTVFGENDDSERFTAVVTAHSEQGAYEAGVTAGCVDESWESDVRIDLILPGDHSQAAIDTAAFAG